MKILTRKLFVTSFVLLCILILSNKGWSFEIDLPHAYFNGLMITYTDNPSGDDLIFASTKINSVFYSNGDSSTTDVIVGKDVMIEGAQRDCPDFPCTAFTDATFSISDDSTEYFSALLTDITFVTDGVQWFLNPDLDVNNQQTMNLSNIVLNPNGSIYIQDLQNVLGSKSIAGMQMRLNNIDGDITGDSSNIILEGLLDGVEKPSPVPEPSTLLLLGSGAIGFAGYRRKMKK